MYSCSDSSEDLAENCTSEDEHIFPQHVCNPCHTKMNREKKARKDGVPFYPIAAMEWSPHDAKDCTVRKEEKNQGI